jgi:hypothetical protein
MDFSRQCKRFLTHTRFSKESFKRTLANISAISVFKNVVTTKTTTTTSYRLVVADNDLKTLFVLNEADGQLIREATLDSLITYGIACTNKPTQNFIYVSDYANNLIRKFDENLKEVKVLKPKPTEELPNATDLNGLLKFGLKKLQRWTLNVF